jgi:methionyl-tRNA formyltransferase
MQKYQVIFFGTAALAIPALDALSKSAEISVKMVVTQPDKPVGRHQELIGNPVKQYARTMNLPILQAKKLRENRKLLEKIHEIKPDLFIVEAYGKILPRELLDIPKHGAINIHISLLPKYRGASPVQQALLNGDTETGITIIKMNEEMDSGDVIFTKSIAIGEDDNLESLTNKLALLGGAVIDEAAIDYMKGRLQGTPQDHSKATFCKKIAKEDGRIHWNLSTAEEIRNQIRALTPWPSCYTLWEGKRLKISEAETEEGSLPPGTIVIKSGSLKIGTKKNLLVPKKVQLEGKKESDIKTFLNGNQKPIEEKPKFE